MPTAAARRQGAKRASFFPLSTRGATMDGMFPGSPARPKYGSFGAGAGGGPPSTTASPTRGYQGHGAFYNGPTTASPMQMSPFRSSGAAGGAGAGRSSLLNPRGGASLKLNFGAPAPMGQAGVAGHGGRVGGGRSGVRLDDAELLQSLSGDAGFSGGSGIGGAGRGGGARGGGGALSGGGGQLWLAFPHGVDRSLHHVMVTSCVCD